MGAADVRVLPHRVLAPAQLKPVGVRGGMFATAPAVAVGAPSAIHRMTTTEIIARARKQVQNPHELRRATTGGLRPIGDRADIQQTIAMLWRELNKLTGAAAAPPDSSPVVSLQRATKRLRATAGQIVAQRKQHAADAAAQAKSLAAAQAKEEQLLETARKLEEQIQAERQQARDNQQAVHAVLQENEQLRQELHTTREALQQALQSGSSVGRGIDAAGSDIRESSASSKGLDASLNCTGSYMQSKRQQQPALSTNAERYVDVRHSVAAISGAALLTETIRAEKGGERIRLRSVEQSLEHECAARKRAETMVEDAEQETQAVQCLRQVETEQWVVELERVESAARDQIHQLAEEREEAREMAMVLQDDLHLERKQNIALETVADAVALGAAAEVERLRSAQIEQLHMQLSAVQRHSTLAPLATTSQDNSPTPSNGSQLSVGKPIPDSLADHDWVNADYNGAEGLCCLGATSPTDSVPMMTPCRSVCSSNPPSRRHPAGCINQLCAGSEEAAAAPFFRSPSKAKAKAGGLRVAIPGETISEAAAVLGGCHAAGCEAEQEGLDLVSSLISGIAANIADQAVAAVQKEKKRVSTSRDSAAESAVPVASGPLALAVCDKKGGARKASPELMKPTLKQQLTVDVDCAIPTDVGVTVTPIGQLRQTCTPNSRYESGDTSGD